MSNCLSERLTGQKRRQDPVAWPESDDQDRTRVLLEYPHTGTPTVLADVLERAGYDSVICEGPAESPDSCRLLRNGECELAADADVIFNGFGLSKEEHRRIVGELRECYPEAALVVESTRLRAEANAELLDGCSACHSPLTAEALLGAVERAEAGRGSDAA